MRACVCVCTGREGKRQNVTVCFRHSLTIILTQRALQPITTDVHSEGTPTEIVALTSDFRYPCSRRANCEIGKMSQIAVPKYLI
jgi:hypothetical protein